MFLLERPVSPDRHPQFLSHTPILTLPPPLLLSPSLSLPHLLSLLPSLSHTFFFSLFLPMQIEPTMIQYELDTFGKSHDLMSNFWNSCFDALMSTAQKPDRDRTDCRNKFQVRPPPSAPPMELAGCGLPLLTIALSPQELVVNPYLKRVRIENSRYHGVMKQLASHQGVVWRHWVALRRLLTSERGAWALR